MQSPVINDVKIVIAVNKNDLWFCRICIASIRYYYPAIEIFLLKDELNGKFSTRELEKYYKVKLLQYNISKFGWSAAKMHFYTDQQFNGQQFLVLDADIVFIGKILNRDFVKSFANDVFINEENVTNPNSEWFTNTYFDYSKVKDFDPSYDFQNYTFNGGQLFCKGGFLNKEILEPFFDFEKYPAWKRLDIFPLVDQSLFNYLLPVMAKNGKLNIGREKYMLWFGSAEVKDLKLKEILTGDKYPFLIHWAGGLRTPMINKMVRSDILTFFEEQYYQQIKFGKYISKLRKVKPISILYSRQFIKKLISKFKFLK